MAWNTKKAKYIGLPIKTKVSLLYHNEPWEISSLDISSVAGLKTSMSREGKAKVITIEADNLTADTLAQITKMNITVVGRYAGANYEYTRELTILKSSDTVVYELIPSSDSIIVDKNGNKTANSVSCDVYATSSDDKRYKLNALPSGMSLKYGKGENATTDSVLGKLASDDKPAYEILETYVGTDLERKEYEPLFECTKECVLKQGKKGHYVVCDSYVTMTDGTGIVHIAPAFGEDDANVGRKYDLPFVQFVNSKGELTEDTPYAGKFVKDADKDVLIDLDKDGKLFEAPKFEHEYPHCWRCDTPLIYYARESWYIKETAVRDDLIRNNNTVNWIPESIGKGRFGNWLENIQDWAISRNRYWGTPLNIWECECGHQECVGGREELKKLSGNDEALTVELHRPYIDEITCKCPKCGGTMKRVPEVIDCWFDSGAMPSAQHHYPFENKELFESQFPAQFISEAVDQTRGWFHSLMAESTLLFNKAPYENVIVRGQDSEKRYRRQIRKRQLQEWRRSLSLLPVIYQGIRSRLSDR